MPESYESLTASGCRTNRELAPHDATSDSPASNIKCLARPTVKLRFEAVTTATASTTKGLQAIAAEITDYSKNSFEKSRAHFEKLVGVKKIDEAIQLQSDFAKSAYEDFVAEATKIGSLYSDLAKEAFTPTKK